MCGKHQIIKSKFIPNFQFLLKIIQVGDNKIFDFLKKSLLDSEIIDECKYLENEIRKIQIPDLDFNDFIKYDELINSGNKKGMYSLSKKTIKKNILLANEIKNNIHNFEELYIIYI